jgi:hypothetical protein
VIRSQCLGSFSPVPHLHDDVRSADFMKICGNINLWRGRRFQTEMSKETCISASSTMVVGPWLYIIALYKSDELERSQLRISNVQYLLQLIIKIIYGAWISNPTFYLHFSVAKWIDSLTYLYRFPYAQTMIRSGAKIGKIPLNLIYLPG